MRQVGHGYKLVFVGGTGLLRVALVNHAEPASAPPIIGGPYPYCPCAHAATTETEILRIFMPPRKTETDSCASRVSTRAPVDLGKAISASGQPESRLPAVLAGPWVVVSGELKPVRTEPEPRQPERMHM